LYTGIPRAWPGGIFPPTTAFETIAPNAMREPVPRPCLGLSHAGAARRMRACEWCVCGARGAGARGRGGGGGCLPCAYPSGKNECGGMVRGCVVRVLSAVGTWSSGICTPTNVPHSSTHRTMQHNITRDAIYNGQCNVHKMQRMPLGRTETQRASGARQRLRQAAKRESDVRIDGSTSGGIARCQRVLAINGVTSWCH
jgi:hypothetical protein